MSILAIGAHPDDVEFGCGGYLARSSPQVAVTIVIATHGLTERRDEAIAAASVLGVRDVIFAAEEDTAVDEARLRGLLEFQIGRLSPSVICTHAPGDSHQDHRAVTAAVVAAARRCRTIWFYETPSTLDFDPSIYVDIHETLPMKLRALRAHASQVGKTWAETRTLDEMAEATAVHRGIQGRLRAAEAFVPLRWGI